MNILPQVFDKLSNNDFNLLHTQKSWRLLTDNLRLLHELDLEKKNSNSFRTEKKFAKLTLDLPKEQNESILNDLLSQISSILYEYHIDIHSAFFTPSSIVLVTEDSKAIKLYDKLHSELSGRMS